MNSPPTGDRDPYAWNRNGDRPPIELAATVDDRRDPTTVTVYPKDARDRPTTWITMDVDWVLALEEMVSAPAASGGGPDEGAVWCEERVRGDGVSGPRRRR